MSRLLPRGRIALVLLGSVLALGYFARPITNPNENSRMGLVLAAYWQRTLSIDAYHRSGPTRTTDESYRAGRFYSDKAPGSSLLAALGYAPVHLWERATGRTASYTARKYAMTFAAGALPVAAALGALFALAWPIAGPRRSALLVLGGLVATPLLPFGSTLLGHATAGALLFLAFFQVHRLARRPEPPRWPGLLGAGALLGLTVVTEYTTAPGALLIAAYGLLLLRRRRLLGSPRVWIGPFLGAAPFAFGLAAYDLACFGSPFSLGYEHLALPYFRAIHAQGLVGVGLPRLDVAYYLTLHPARGLFLHAPVLLLALPGVWAMLRLPRWRVEALLCVAVFLSFLIVNSGFGLWWGGYTYTARHLVPAVPFLLLPIAFLPRGWWWAALPLLVASAAQSLVAAFGDPFSSDAFLVLRLRELQRSGGGLVPWSGAWSVRWDVWPLLRARSEAGRWIGFAPSAGRLLGLTGPASGLPFLAAVPLVFALAGRRPGPRQPSLVPASRARRPALHLLGARSGEGAA